MKIYIAGPIASDSNFKQKFDAAESFLRKSGYEVVNPTVPDEKPSWEDFPSWGDWMKRDIPKLLECEAIYMLPNWHTSRGASLEFYIARELGMTIYFDPVKLPRSICHGSR